MEGENPHAAPAQAGRADDDDPQARERAWIQRASAGDRSAQEELLRLHYPRIHATAFRLLGNPEDAEDLAQECFVRAFRSFAYFRGEGSLAGWLRRILVHLAQDRYRSQGKRPESTSLSASLSGGAEPHGVLEERELGRVLADALQVLAPALRGALLLRTRERLEYEEIGSLTGVTPATARTRVMKARRVLMRLMTPYLGRPSDIEGRRNENVGSRALQKRSVR
jgi:RNA polymerase sigma-70 factor (ECF subfamily)